jgi:hypothetical protein
VTPNYANCMPGKGKIRTLRERLCVQGRPLIILHAHDVIREDKQASPKPPKLDFVRRDTIGEYRAQPPQQSVSSSTCENGV